MQANSDQANRLVYFTGAAAVAAAMTMIAIKAVAWYLTQSVMMLAALLDSFMDSMMSVLIFFSLRYAMQPADKEHRFGHGKAEAIAAFVQGLILIIAAIFLFSQAVSNLYNPQPVNNIIFGISASLTCIVITLLLVFMQSYAIKKTGSLALKADRLHYRMDILIYFAAILTLALTQFFQNTRIDALAGSAVALYIVIQAAAIIMDSLKQLMDHELPDTVREKIKKIVRQNENVHDIHDLRTRMSGRQQVIQFHIEMDGTISLAAAHLISDDVEAAILNSFPGADVIIHQDPQGIEKLSSLEKS